MNLVLRFIAMRQGVEGVQPLIFAIAKQRKTKNNSTDCCLYRKTFYVCQTKTEQQPQTLKFNPIMKAIKLTSEQMKNDSGREYNPQIWNQKISQLMTFSNVEFFKVERDDVYQYDRYFSKYQLADGMIFFNDFGYSSMISNSGFQQIVISTFDVQKLELMPENTVDIFGLGRWIDGSKTSLNHMKKMSIQYETIWSKSGI